MKKNIISDAITHISSDYIEQAAEYTVVRRQRMPRCVKWGVLAACAALIFAAVGHIGMPRDIPDNGGADTVTVEDLNRPYREFTVQALNMAVAWQWQYLTVPERYLSIDIDGVNFIRLGEELDATVIREKIGTYEAVGDNEPYETPEGGYRERFDAYTIQAISPAYMVALKMEDDYYCFISDIARAQLAQAGWGEVLDTYGLSDAIRFGAFARYTNGRDPEGFMLEDDAYVWEVLQSCTAAAFVSPSEWSRAEEYYSFSVTSDVYGIYKKAFYVTPDGYIWTNILDVECIYDIGKEAADKIIAYLRDKGEPTALKAYQQTVVGTVTEITQDYLLVDDSVLCTDANDGIVFTVMLNDLKINRYVDTNQIRVGDTVEIVYKGSIDTENGYVIDSAYAAAPVAIADGVVAVTE